ncbi:4-hydroxy-3-methylbut-2-enyl diphosphate reductase [bacterium]|uniref:4-hydroxy-3-methylbut-2-enyl diphosphate reductase n=1 Tax=Candidatus Scatenecus faecavium TaxID=2840915 RepID=A0A9D1FX19_9BACT|nr:4-hydroxy-3-methylbut-2-enyl diphosphate reductase [bacterium]HIS83021.1 4-hydroxy-3-methylbut-2-enyl diphosphate reductase [Candidatus Scatenecus faecavium]
MPKKIELAKYAGFCYGVKRAVETAKKLKAENPDKEVFVLGELIHNAHVINELESLRIKTLYEIPQTGEGICVIRSHGESPEVIEKIKQAGFTIVDLTCPDVKKVQQKAVELAKEGYFVVIVGKSEHPEVVAIKANALLWSENVAVAASVEQLKEFETKIKAHRRAGVVVQTTQRLETLNSIVNYLTSITKEIHIANTICQSTSMRQNEAKALAKEADLMVVVGSKKSANTTHLAEILNGITKTIHIESPDELDLYKDLTENAEKISVTAGASTPQKLIEAVVNRLDTPRA